MALDWSVVVVPMVGAAIGLAGEWSGRRSARRESERLHERTVREAAEARFAQLEEARQRRVEDRERQALEAILSSLTDFPPISVVEANPAEARPAVAAFASLCAIERMYVVSPDLRRLLAVAVEGVDLASGGHLETFTLAESLYVTRQVVRHAVGTYLRGEQNLPTLSDDWERLSTETLTAISRWKAGRKRPGFDVESLT